MIIAKTLRYGVLLSASLVLLGGVLFLVQHGSDDHVNPLFSQTAQMQSLSVIVMKAIQGDSSALIMLGLSTLFMTQVLRVALTIAFFMSLRAYIHVSTSLFVFAVLITSIW